MITTSHTFYKTVSLLFLVFSGLDGFTQDSPEALGFNRTSDTNYLPDFSYAGYAFGEKRLPKGKGKIVHASDYGVIANDGLDDSKALLSALAETKKMEGNIILQLPKGRLILSDILYIERDNFVLRGAGSGDSGTEIYCPRPMMYLEGPEVLKELREYLLEFDKRQREPQNNIDLPFSQYAWSGGMIWTQVPGERVKSYLGKYDTEDTVLAKIENGKRGEHVLEASEIHNLRVGDVVQLQLFNKSGSVDAELVKDMYKGANVKIGSHHWEFATLPLVRQEVLITKISKNKITIKTPLTVDIKSGYEARLVRWKHLREVGMEHFKMSFPDASFIAHHVERGFNGIFLTRLFNSWVDDVVIHNADSGILTEEIANVTISDIKTTGSNRAHYTVAMAGVHNVLVDNLRVYNVAEHPLSFNTFSTKNVYTNCEVFSTPVLDQHSGANHQNLFDNITVHVSPSEDSSYPLFAGGGAPYWKPSHGAFNTFWNIDVHFLDGLENTDPILLNGMEDGPFANVIGVFGNHPLRVEYGPDAHIEFSNMEIREIPSLYDYQLKSRLK